MNKLEQILAKAKAEGKTDAQVASIVADFYARKYRKKTVEQARQEVRERLFAGVTKKTFNKTQQEQLMYDYVEACAGHFADWLRDNHNELFAEK